MMHTIAAAAAMAVIGANASPFLDNEIRRFSGGSTLTMEGMSWVPVRRTFEALGANVRYSPQSHGILITKGESVLRLDSDTKSGTVNEWPIRIDRRLKLIKGQSYMPTTLLGEVTASNISTMNGSLTLTPWAALESGLGTIVVKSRSENWLAAGDEIKIMVAAPAGSILTFDLVGIANDVAIPVNSEGIYEAVYKVPTSTQLMLNRFETSLVVYMQTADERLSFKTTPLMKFDNTIVNRG